MSFGIGNILICYISAAVLDDANRISRTLVPEKYPQPNIEFMAQNGIRHFQVHIPANKGTVCVPQCQMTEALGILLDRSNHPLLIHCNKGKVGLTLPSSLQGPTQTVTPNVCH
jgi:Tyrosine phosphatase family